MRAAIKRLAPRAARALVLLYVLGGASWAVHKYFVQQDTLIFFKAVEMQGNVRCTQS